MLFLLSFIAAVVIAAALATRPIGAFALGGIGLSLLTLVAFTLSRTSGLFGFTEKEFSELPAVLAAFAELGTIVASGLWHWATCSATSAALAKPATPTGGPST